jgi:hypothetical protein
MKSITLLFVLAVLLVSTAIAQVDTLGQFEARQVVSRLSETDNAMSAPSFFAVADFGKVVAVGQAVSLRINDFVTSPNGRFFVCRNVGNVCLDPVASGGAITDTVPNSPGRLMVYVIAKTDATMKIVDFGYVSVFVNLIPEGESLGYVTNSVSAEAVTVQPCDGLPPGVKCPMFLVNQPNYFRVKTSGVYPANTTMFVLATAKDGSSGHPVSVGTREFTDSLFVTIPIITRNRTFVSLTTWNPETREFQTAVDAIGPLPSTGSFSAVR